MNSLTIGARESNSIRHGISEEFAPRFLVGS